MEPRPEDPIKSFVVPAPTKGLNYKQAYPFMDPDTAISMSNLIPNGATVDVRGALRKWNTISTASTLKGLFTYNCTDGNSYLIGYAEYTMGGTIHVQYWDLTTESPRTFVDVDSAMPPGSFQEPAPMAVNFNGYLFCITGAAQAYETTRIGPPTGGGVFTGADAVAALGSSTSLGHTFSTIGVYKNRIYIGQGPTLWGGGHNQVILYSNTNQISGQIPIGNQYDVSYLTKHGGKIIFCDSVTRQEGSLSQSLLAVVTENGEVLVFQGDYPGSTTWAIVGYYVIPKPLGKRAFFYVGSSLYIITQAGIFSFADLTNNYGISSEIGFTSDYINNNFPTYASYALTLNSLTQGVTSWYGTFYPKENKIFIGYPESPSTYGMLVQDLTTKGWGQLNYQNQVAGLTVFNNGLYGFAPASYTYSLQGLNTHDEVFKDNKWSNWPISISAQLAPNYNEDFSTTKQFNEIKALVQCTSPYSITAGLTVDFDLRSCGTTNYSKMTGGTYGLYQPRFNAGDRENVGKCVILNLGGQFNAADLPMKFIAFEVYYTTGGNW